MKTPPFVYILKMATSKKISDKKAILREAAVNGCEELFVGFQIAMNKRRTFYVKAAPLIEVDQSLPQRELMKPGSFTWDDFLTLVNKLEKGNLTDSEIKGLLYNAAENSGILEWNVFYRSILMKNMKCGITAKTINNILEDFGVDAKKYVIPIWRTLKLHDNGLMMGIKAIEPLLDGNRMIAVLDKERNTVKLFNETGIENKKFDEIKNSLKKLLPSISESIIFDGNVTDRDFQGLMTSNHSDDKHYIIYDILTLSDFDNGHSSLTLVERREVLSDLQQELRENSNGLVFVMPCLVIDLDEEKAMKKLNEFCDEAKNAGYTAIVIKNANDEYSQINNLSWFKKQI